MSDKLKPMDSGDLTTDQADQMNRSLFPLVNYLCRTVKRMERTGFPPDDSLFKSARLAYDEVRSLTVELHYLSCKSGVSRPPKENRERTRGRFPGEP